jgi:ComF family protein
MLVVEALLSIVAPPRCAACDARVPLLRAFCAPCASSVERAAPGAGAPFEYGGALTRAIGRFKYEDRPDLGRPLGALLANAVPASPVDVVVPVPMHPRRLAERGYNHAALLARPVAARLGARFGATALTRTRDGERQAKLSKDYRHANVAGAFAAASAQLRGRRVLIVDDVRTTGATLGACAAAAKDAGALHVATLVLAVAT